MTFAFLKLIKVLAAKGIGESKFSGTSDIVFYLSGTINTTGIVHQVTFMSFVSSVVQFTLVVFSLTSRY